MEVNSFCFALEKYWKAIRLDRIVFTGCLLEKIKFLLNAKILSIGDF
jgi:hypothetical protein